MAYTTVDDPTQNFNTIVWTGAGDSSARSFTGVGFQPDWVWYKSRSETYNNNFVDSASSVYKGGRKIGLFIYSIMKGSIIL